MDFRNVTGVTIPAGNVSKISIGGVVYWQNASGNKYKIMKDGVQLAEVTISQLVKQVNSGAAQEDYGIGAQIIVPYHDTFDDNDYELPFNFGTFTAYGEGKLGLQSHYCVPTADLPYVASDNPAEDDYKWRNTIIRKWLNAYNTEHEVAALYYTNSIGFLGCLPEDFVDIMNITNHGNDNDNGILISSKVFLPSATNVLAGTGDYSSISSDLIIHKTIGDGENSVWEYWQNRIGILQDYSVINLARISEKINHSQTSTFGSRLSFLPNICTGNDNISIASFIEAQNSYSNKGMYTSSKGTPYFVSSNYNKDYRSRYGYLPACVIG